MTNKTKNTLKMLIPSLIGILLFLIPIKRNGSTDILIGVFVSKFKGFVGDVFVPLLIAVIVISALLTLIQTIHPLGFISNNERLKKYFQTSWFWTISRLIGAIISVLTYFKIGPDWLWSADTGANMLFTLMPTCAAWYIVAGFFLPLLTDYGLLDVVGALTQKAAKVLFLVPGRAMIDCLTSWVGSSVCGTYLTISQYEKGFYNAREASTIISNFSLLSISFCFLIASMLNLQNSFGYFYLTIVIAGIIVAAITPRIPPLNKIPEEYEPSVGNRVEEKTQEGLSNFQWGWMQGLKRAEEAPGVGGLILNGADTAINLMVTTLSVIMAFGTIALIVATYTPVFNYLGYPLGLFLKVFKVPEAMTAGSAMLMGFADQYIPVILGASYASEYTRFMLGCISILQIIYITDIGSLVMTSKLPLSLGRLFLIFLERVLICVPIVAFCAHIFGIA